jgi:hypothetical protein
VVSHTTSALFFPMDLWTHRSASVLGRMNCKATCRKLCRAASYGPTFERRADLSSRPGGCAMLASMAKQAPLPKPRHYRNPASKSSGASSRSTRLAESIGFKGEFRHGNTFCGWRLSRRLTSSLAPTNFDRPLKILATKGSLAG